MTAGQQIHVGTSGWHYSHWRGPFYPERFPSDRMLDFYCQRLHTVEINNSFYQLPEKKTFTGWREQTPQGFLFAVKASRYLTHMKKLKDPTEPLRRFHAHVQRLGPKLGPILFQLPPHWGRDAGRLRDFLRVLPKKRQYAFEFRDPSWFHPETYRLLEKHHAAFCVWDLAGMESPRVVTADFAYLRLHGPSQQKYAGRYTKRQLRGWLQRLRTWQRQGARAVYVYFDNDQAGYAARNALEFAAMVNS
ncbi:MAG: DUF72 domain-containing protein [Candidatus Acidoferrales bacterium]